MTLPTFPRLVFILLGCLALIAIGQANAQTYPTKPIRIVVPFAPGGGADVIARFVAPKLTESWAQTVVIDNRPGAAGLLGAALVSKADPDGHTLLLTALGGVTKQTLDEFMPVVLLAAPPNVLVVHPDVKANNMRELLAHVRANPGRLNYGSAGLGSLSHLAGELLNSMAKVEIVHIPYKGMGQVVTELLGNHVQLAIAPLPAVHGQIKNGKLRALAVTGSSRYAPLPNLPTVAESGVPGYEAINWFGLLAPARVSPAITMKVNAEVNRIIQLGDVKERLQSVGADPVGGAASDFASYIRIDTEKWAKLIKDANIELK